MHHTHGRVRTTFALAVLVTTFASAPGTYGKGFSLGVAAGDVTGQSVVLWARADAPGDVRLELAQDASFEAIIHSAVAAASADHDLTVKLDVDGLTPATTYAYRFVREDDSAAMSRTGTFRTAPAPDTPADVRFLFSGDSNYEWAPLAVFSHAAEETADLFIWFGDLIYGDVPAAGLGAATTLADYRAKYRQIRSDPHVQEALARMAIWVGRDDHEVYNDYAGLDPSLTADQREAAYQAFFEYMPIRAQEQPDDPFRTYRRFQYGSAIEFLFLDARQYREPSAAAGCGSNPDPQGFLLGLLTADADCQSLLAEDRAMLGQPQRAWLESRLVESTAAVKIIVNNVPLTYMGVWPYDRWDGYDEERRGLLEFIDAGAIDGVVVLTTDTHANVLNPDVTRYFRHHRPDYALTGRVAVPELVVGPIGTHTLRGELIEVVDAVTGLRGNGLVLFALDQAVGLLSRRLERINGLTFVELDRVGYAIIDACADGSVRVTYRGVHPDDARDRQATIETLHEAPVRPVPSVPCFLWPLMAVGGAFGLVRRGSSGPRLR